MKLFQPPRSRILGREQQAKAFPNNLTRAVIKAGSNLLSDPLLQFGRQRHVHRNHPPSGANTIPNRAARRHTRQPATVLSTGSLRIPGAECPTLPAFQTAR